MSLLEVPVFVILGLMSAVVAAGFVRAVAISQSGFAKLPVPAWLHPAIGGLMIGGIAIAFPQVLGVGYQATDLALKEALPLTLMAALVVAKLAATSLAIGSGFAGSVFSPSVFIGAMAGGTFGLLAAALLPGFVSTEGAYVVTGMAAVTASVLGAPISTILIVFELTGSFQLTIVVMTAAPLASIVMQKLVPQRSFFLWQLDSRDVRLPASQEEGLLLATPIDDVISNDFLSVTTDANVIEVREQIARERPRAIMVIDDEGRLFGSLSAADVLGAGWQGDGAHVTVGDCAREPADVLVSNASLDRALKLMGLQDGNCLAVVQDFEERKLIGVVHHKDLLQARAKVLLEVQA